MKAISHGDGPLTHSTNLPAGRRLRTREAAEYLGLSASYLEKFRVTGGGPRFAAFGRAVSYAVADLDAWAATRTVRNTSEARAQRRAGVA
jgi:predicted DNA-binding transcriptional regulator AlpA